MLKSEEALEGHCRLVRAEQARETARQAAGVDPADKQAAESYYSLIHAQSPICAGDPGLLGFSMTASPQVSGV